jgi:hypothetical protein
MAVAYLYTKSADFPGGSLDPTQLKQEIEASSITTAVDNIFVGLNDPLGLSPILRGTSPGASIPDRVEIVFVSALSAGELTTLDGDINGPSGGLIALHPQGLPPVDPDPPDEVGDPVYYEAVAGGPGGLGLPATDGSQLVNISHDNLVDVSANDHHARYTDVEAATAADYAGRFEAATVTTGDIGLNKWGWWYNTSTSQLFIVRNRGGVLFCVETDEM